MDQKFAMQEMNVTKLPLEVCRLPLLKINTLQNTTQSPNGGEPRLPGLGSEWQVVTSNTVIIMGGF